MNRERACKGMEERLVLYHYGELSPEERSGVEAHLAVCGRCGSELEAVRALGYAPVYVPNSGEVRDAVLGVMSAVRNPEDRIWNRRWVPAYIGAAVAAAAIVLSVYVPDLVQKTPQNQVIAQADWEMLENFDIAKDYNTIEELDNFESLDQQNM